jgi:hypothetical protein
MRYRLYLAAIVAAFSALLIGSIPVASGASISQAQSGAYPHKKKVRPKHAVVLTIVVKGSVVSLCPDSLSTCGEGISVATCPKGYTISGGGWNSERLTDATVQSSGPGASNDWVVQIHTDRSDPPWTPSTNFWAEAICQSVQLRN